MPTISVITPVVDGKQEHIGAAYQSLLDQEMPAGWAWQWIVQEDGETGRPLAELPPDPRISAGAGRRGGAATARTLALSRAGGELIRGLDADDVLLPGALERDIATLTEHPEVGWCVSPAVDLLPDGSLKPGPRDPDPGPLPARFLADGERGGMLQVLGTTACAHTQLIRALGGWAALPQAEDAALVLALEAAADGWMIGEPSLLYRRWSGNSTVDVDKSLPQQATVWRTVMLDRVDALHALGWRWSSHPLPHPPSWQQAEQNRSTVRQTPAAPHEKEGALLMSAGFDYKATVLGVRDQWQAAIGHPPPRNDTTGAQARLNIAVNGLAQHGEWHEIRSLMYRGADFLSVLSLVLRNIHIAPVGPGRSDLLTQHLGEARKNTDLAYNSICDIITDLARLSPGDDSPTT